MICGTGLSRASNSYDTYHPNRMPTLDYLLGLFQPTGLEAFYLFSKIRNEFISFLILVLSQACLITPQVYPSQKHPAEIHSWRLLEHLANLFSLLGYLNILGREINQPTYTCPAARTLPSVEKVQQSPLFKGATCTGYSSSILQNLTILKSKEKSYQRRHFILHGILSSAAQASSQAELRELS